MKTTAAGHKGRTLWTDALRPERTHDATATRNEGIGICFQHFPKMEVLLDDKYLALRRDHPGQAITPPRKASMVCPPEVHDTQQHSSRRITVNHASQMNTPSQITGAGNNYSAGPIMDAPVAASTKTPAVWAPQVHKVWKMEVWLLNNMSTAVLAVLVVGGIVFASLLGDLLCRRWFPSTSRGAHNDMVSVVLSLFGAIYGVILAFVIVNLWTQVQEAENVVASEATAVAQVIRDTQALPPGPRKEISTAVGRYVHAVAEEQWPLMREGHADYGRTAAEIDDIYRALQSFVPTDRRQQIFLEHAVSSLDDVVDHRRHRIAQSNQQLPVLLQTLVFGGALVILPLTFLYGRDDRRLEVIFVGSVSSLLGLSVLLVVVLDRPFSGDISVGPQPFKDGILAQFWAMP